MGVFAQLKRGLTKKRYRAATIFVDHFSGYKYAHLMTNLSLEETVAAKRAFERHASELIVTVLHYHADNGRFCDNAFQAACKQGGETSNLSRRQRSLSERSSREGNQGSL